MTAVPSQAGLLNQPGFQEDQPASPDPQSDPLAQLLAIANRPLDAGQFNPDQFAGSETRAVMTTSFGNQTTTKNLTTPRTAAERIALAKAAQNAALAQRRAQLQGALFGALPSLLDRSAFAGAGDTDVGIAGIREARESQIEEDFQDELNTLLARLEDRGLGGSSFALTAGLGAERGEQRAKSQLEGELGSLQLQAAQSTQQRNMQLLQSLLGTVF